jgi:hypothetical protein
MAAMIVAAGPAFASHVTEHPFRGSGEQYAQEHITVIAQNEPPGLTGPPHASRSCSGNATCSGSPPEIRCMRPVRICRKLVVTDLCGDFETSVVGSLLMSNSLSRVATDWREGRRFGAFELSIFWH